MIVLRKVETVAMQRKSFQTSNFAIYGSNLEL